MITLDGKPPKRSLIHPKSFPQYRVLPRMIGSKDNRAEGH